MPSCGLHDLPLEIREIIWGHSLPDDEPEVCILIPKAFRMTIEPYLLVDTAFPVLMHVCRESRAFVLNTNLSSVQFRHSDLASCGLVPFRSFRPEMDTLFFENVVNGRMSDYTRDFRHILKTFPDLQHLAFRLPTPFSAISDIIKDHLSQFKTVTFVATNPWQLSITHSAMFRTPVVRCKLEQCTTAETSQMSFDEPWRDFWRMCLLPGFRYMPVEQFLDSLSHSHEHGSMLMNRYSHYRHQQSVFRVQKFMEYQAGTWQPVNASNEYEMKQSVYPSHILDRQQHPQAYVKGDDGTYILKRELSLS